MESKTPIEITLSRLNDMSGDMLCVIGKDGRFLVTNHAFDGSLGYSKDELRGQDALGFVHPSDREGSEQCLRESWVPAATCLLRNRFRHKDGRYKELSWTLSTADEEDVICARVTLVSPANGGKQSAVISDNFNRSIIRSSGDCIKVLDLDGCLQYMSQGGQELLNIRDIKPYLGVSYDSFWEGSDKQASKKAMADALRGLQGRFQGYAPTVEGEPRWWDVVITPIFGETYSIENLLVISRDITKRIRAEKALAESEQLLRKAQSFAQIGHWTLECDMRTAYWSEEVFRITGQKSDVVPGPDTLKRIIHPDDISSTMDSLGNAITRGLEHDVEYRIIRPDHEVRWVACKATPVFDADGHVIRLSGIVQDITKRKRSEDQIQASLDEKEVLLREVHHRVKNNLQVIASLLSLQAVNLSNKEAVEALTESARRVQLMAKIHNRLYRSTNLAHVEFDIFLKSLAEEMIASYSADDTTIQLHLDLDDVSLSLEQAIPCSQIVSELVSNSIKHAFSGIAQGTIVIALHADSNRIYLSISDDGGGMPDDFEWSHAQSLGLKVIQALAGQLDADLVMERRNGTYCGIAFDRECGDGQGNIGC